MATAKKLKGIALLMRPIEWSKTFINMLLGAFLAIYLLTDGKLSLGIAHYVFFLSAFLVAGPLLWGGLYMLNDWTDHRRDSEHKLKSKRPIPAGIISPNAALIFSIFLISISLILGYFIGILFLVCLLAMLLNQLAYTLKPIRLKERPYVDLISGSLVNPLFRFYSGWVLFSNSFNAPLLIIIVLLSFQYAGFTLYRLGGRKYEIGWNYRSTIAVAGKKAVRISTYVAIVIGTAAYILTTIYIIPFKFIWLAVLSAFFFPLYLDALRDPEKVDMGKMYKIMYSHLVCFIIGFIALLLWL